MTIYVEVIFISNFLIDLFICVLTLMINKSAFNAFRLIMCSTIGGISAAIYPLISSYGYIVKVITAILIPALLKKHKKFSEYAVSLSTFLCVTLILGGLALSLTTVFSDSLTYEKLTYGIFPILLSVSGILLIFLLKFLKKELIKTRNRNVLIYEATIANENCSLRCKAFYDSGNRVYTKNGERVVIVNSAVYNKLMPAQVFSVAVSTPAGSFGMPVTDAILKIYFGDGENKIYKVKAGKGNVAVGDTQIILHSDMLGEYI